MNRTADTATAKVFARTGRVITGKSYEAVAAKYFALTGNVL